MASPSSERSPIVEFRRVSKSFGKTRALSQVDLALYPGEVHVLAGENGAGKSTLIKILAGAIGEFEGELLVGGLPARFRTPNDATRAKIATIHQELSLVGPMSVVDNLFLGESAGLFTPYSAGGGRHERAVKMLADMELDVDPNQSVESLPLAVRQLVEIARALAREARVIVMDEPTSALAEPDTERLFRRIDELRRANKSVIFISHRMEEIFRLADRITVLRDGKRVLTEAVSALDPERLVAAMIGKELAARSESPTRNQTETVLAVNELSLDDPAASRRALLDRISFRVGAGEVLGIAGLQGSGASELLHAIYGSFGARVRGSLAFSGEKFVPKSPQHAIACGIVLVPNDRRASVLSEMSITKNATLSSLRRFSRFGFIDPAIERSAVSRVTQRLAVSAASLDSTVAELSGGNQQKVALARALLVEPKLLLLDDPTRGIDVSAKADVHALVAELAQAGNAVVFVASEIDELVSLCDRVLVLFRGRLVADFAKPELSRERVLGAAMGAVS